MSSINSPVEITIDQFELPAELENLPLFLAFVTNLIRQQDYSSKCIKEIELVIEEALVNVMEYAYPDQPGSISLTVKKQSPGELMLEIRDRGVTFNPLELEAPDLEAGLEERPIGGLGVVMMKSLTDNITWHRENGENCLNITFEPHHVC